VTYLAAQVFIGPQELHVLRRNPMVEDSVTTNPIAFLPPTGFPRMSAQSSRFTIHPPPDSNSTLEALLRAHSEIVRYIIPADCKISLSRDLTALGITAETLVCSLDALSTTIKIDVYDSDRGDVYPDPPVFD
jgi:hypothetical protein